MPGKHSNDIIKGNIDRRRSWHTFRVSITVLFKTPLPWPTPPLLRTETRMETLPRPTYQPAAQRTDEPTLTRDHRPVGAAFYGPIPGRFFSFTDPSPHANARAIRNPTQIQPSNATHRKWNTDLRHLPDWRTIHALSGRLSTKPTSSTP